jgi:hypothetical protein
MAISTIGTNSLSDPIAVNGYTPTASNMQPFNRIINGAMTIDQRNAGASCYSTAPAGFINYLGYITFSLFVGFSERFIHSAKQLEGFNLADLAWGTASASTVTLSFWVRSSLLEHLVALFKNSGQQKFLSI